MAAIELAKELLKAEAALERAEADVAVMRELVRKHAYKVVPQPNGGLYCLECGKRDGTHKAVCAVRQALSDHPGGKLLDAEDDNWLVRQLESCRAEVATWPEHKRRAMLAALDGGTG